MPASITLTVAHLPTATSFFLACLQPLGYVYRGRIENTIGFGLPNAAPDFWITQSIPGVPPGPAHVAFPAPSREVVRHFFIAAMKTGARCQGEPALRDFQSGYYSAAVIDFDNNSIEAVYRDDVRGLRNDSTSASVARSNIGAKQSTTAKSKAPTVISAASKANSTALTETRSVGRSTAPAAATAPATTLVSRATSKAGTQAASQYKAPDSGLAALLDEAKGTLNVARELVSSVGGNKAKNSSDSDSHGPSDAIVGTLLGVAAGAALHFAFSNRTKSEDEAMAQDVPHPGIARSETAPSYSQDRYRFYHDYTVPRTRLAIDQQPSTHSGVSVQRRVEMIDNDQERSNYVPSTTRERRRNSFTGPVPSQAFSVRTKTPSTIITAPPTSYRASKATAYKTARSRSSSASRDSDRTIRPTSSPKKDEGYASASETPSRSSRRSSLHYDKPAVEPLASQAHHSRHRRGSESHGQKSSVVTAIRTLTEPLATRTKRASSSHRHHHRETVSEAAGPSPHAGHTASKRPPLTDSTLLTRKQLNRLESSGRPAADITHSVAGKVKDMDRLGLSSKEVRPEDSVSQVSSNPSSGRRRK